MKTRKLLNKISQDFITGTMLTPFIANLKRYKLITSAKIVYSTIYNRIQIRFNIIFLKPRNFQIEPHNNLLTIRILTLPVTG